MSTLIYRIYDGVVPTLILLFFPQANNRKGGTVAEERYPNHMDQPINDQLFGRTHIRATYRIDLKLAEMDFNTYTESVNFVQCSREDSPNTFNASEKPKEFV